MMLPLKSLLLLCLHHFYVPDTKVRFEYSSLFLFVKAGVFNYIYGRYAFTVSEIAIKFALDTLHGTAHSGDTSRMPASKISLVCFSTSEIVPPNNTSGLFTQPVRSSSPASASICLMSLRESK
jgi:hypothetical protein